METTINKSITIEATVNADINKIWTLWNDPAAIQEWCWGSSDWHVPACENDLRVGGRFKTTMAAKDGSFSFDFAGTYTAVNTNKSIAYTLDDNRKVTIDFTQEGDAVNIVETFEMENQNPEDMQRAGWQTILNNFKEYAEKH